MSKRVQAHNYVSITQLTLDSLGYYAFNALKMFGKRIKGVHIKSNDIIPYIFLNIFSLCHLSDSLPNIGMYHQARRNSRI